ANSCCRSSSRENARQSVTATRLRERCYNACAWPRGGTVDTADLKSASGKPECRFESGRGHQTEMNPISYAAEATAACKARCLRNLVSARCPQARQRGGCCGR